MTPKILIIDDEPDIVTAYTDILAAHGFEVQGALTRTAALDALTNLGPWDVILLDEYLRGSAGTATAAQILLEIAGLAPEARTLVITGFASEKLVRDAVAAGAWDYLEKGATYFKVLLPLRVRHAVEAARERRLRAVAAPTLERELRETWASVRAPGLTASQKGRVLEETMALLFRTMPGFCELSLNRHGSAEEFDVVVTNASTDPVLAKEGSWFLVECKNWSRPVDPIQLDYLRTKLRDRYGRVKLGLLVAPLGFTAGVDQKIARQSNEDQLVLPIDGPELDAWIGSPDRVAWLRQRLERGVLRG